MNITNDDPALVIPIPWPRAGKLPGRLSFISTDDSGFVLSSLHRTNDQCGLVVRFYNILPESLEARINSFWAIKNAWLANLNEEKQVELPLLDPHTFLVKARGNQIITFILDMETL